MGNTITLTADRANTTLPVEFQRPDTGAWVDGVLVSGTTNTYRAVFTGIPAGTYANILKARLKGSTPEVSYVFGGTVTVVDTTSGGGGPQAPTITNFTPASGAVNALVAVYGAHLAGTTAVKLNGQPATFAQVSDTEVDFTVPAGATSGTIAITTPGGTVTSASAFTVTVASAGVNSGKIIVLDGQSQVVGKAPTSALSTLKPALLQTFPNVYIQSQAKDSNGNYTYAPLRAGLNNYAAEQEVPGGGFDPAFGPELELAYQWQQNNPSETLLLVKHPTSGTFLSQHVKGTPQYATMLERVNAARAFVAGKGYTPNILAYVYGQGESDAAQDENNNYAAINPPGQADPTRRAAEVQFVADLRADGLMGGTSRYIYKGVRGYNTFNTDMQAAFAGDTLTRYISTDSYGVLPDGLHYDAPSEVHYGDDVYAALYSAATTTGGGTGGGGTGTVGGGGTASVTVEDTNSLFYYQPGVVFQTPNNVSDGGGTSHALQGTDGFIGFTFTGDKLALDHIGSSGFTIQYDVYINDVYRSTVTVSPATSALQERFSIGGLGSGSHNAKLVGRADYNAYLWLDRVRLAAGGALATYAGTTTYPYPNAIDDQNASVVYANGWNSFDEPNAHNGKLHYTGPGETDTKIAQVPVPNGATKAHIFAPLWGGTNTAFAQHTRFLVGTTLLDELDLPNGSETSRERLVLTLPANTSMLNVTNTPGSGKMGILDYIVFE